MKRAIATLEKEVQAGRIAAWGLATWDGLRVPPEHPDHLSIAEVLEMAKDVAGAGHHFRGVQLPSNLQMAQGTAYRSQETEHGRQPALPAARAFNLAAFGSASILQGRLAAVELPEEIAEAFPGLETSGQQALQFARSAPGVTTALVGVSSPEHAAEDFALAKVPPAAPDRILRLFA
jgi:aryl-alcohol dehydrogenase-like predicted oxidoreductase